MTLHVSTSPNFSPTRTDVRSAFHQQRIGSDSTSPGLGARGAIAGALEPAGRGGGGVPCGTTTGAGRDGGACAAGVCAAGVCDAVVCAETGTSERTCPTTNANATMSPEPLI